MSSPPAPSLIDHFAALEDPRQSWKVLFPLPEVLLLVLCGTLAEAEGSHRGQTLEPNAPGLSTPHNPDAKLHSRSEITDGDHGRIEHRGPPPPG